MLSCFSSFNHRFRLFSGLLLLLLLVLPRRDGAVMAQQGATQASYTIGSNMALKAVRMVTAPDGNFHNNKDAAIGHSFTYRTETGASARAQVLQDGTWRVTYAGSSAPNFYSQLVILCPNYQACAVQVVDVSLSQFQVAGYGLVNTLFYFKDHNKRYGMRTIPVPACQATNMLMADYFDNVNRWGAPEFTQCEALPLDHADWSGGDGATCVGPVNNGRHLQDVFGAHFYGDVTFPLGANYVFTATVTEGTTVKVDGSVLINGRSPNAIAVYQKELFLNSGTHGIDVTYYHNSGDCALTVTWELQCPGHCSGHGECNHKTGHCVCVDGFQGDSCSDRACPKNCIDKNHGSCNTGSGVCECAGNWTGIDCSDVICDPSQWKAVYYNNRNLQEPKVIARCESEVEHLDWAFGNPPGPVDTTHGIYLKDNFSGRFSRIINISQPQTFVFTAVCNDGCQLIVDSTTTINEWPPVGSKLHKHGQTFRAYSYLEAGAHQLLLTYYKSVGEAELKLHVGRACINDCFELRNHGICDDTVGLCRCDSSHWQGFDCFVSARLYELTGAQSRCSQSSTDEGHQCSDALGSPLDTTVFSATQFDSPGSWWQVDLGKVMDVRLVRIYFNRERISQLTNFTVYLSLREPLPDDSPDFLRQNSIWWTDSMPYNSTNLVANFMVERSGRYLRIQTSQPTSLALNEVSAWGYNVLYEEDAIQLIDFPNAFSQSSDYRFDSADYNPAANAADGNFSTFSRTRMELNPWWSVDFGHSRVVSHLEIVNRQDMPFSLPPFFVMWSSKPLPADRESALAAASGSSSLVADVQWSYRLPLSVMARYLRIQMAPPSPINGAIGEVLAYGPVHRCPNGCFAQEQHGRCNFLSGVCQCATVLRGPHVLQYTGDDCSSLTCPANCSGAKQGSCDSTTGFCTCTANFTGSDCSARLCPLNCSGPNQGKCDPLTATCKCSSARYYGSGCELIRCAPVDTSTNISQLDVSPSLDQEGVGEGEIRNGYECSGHGFCNASNGTCRCDSPYTGLDCSVLACPNHCTGHGRCDSAMGLCHCIQGYTALDCSTWVGGAAQLSGGKTVYMDGRTRQASHVLAHADWSATAVFSVTTWLYLLPAPRDAPECDQPSALTHGDFDPSEDASALQHHVPQAVPLQRGPAPKPRIISDGWRVVLQKAEEAADRTPSLFVDITGRLLFQLSTASNYTAANESQFTSINSDNVLPTCTPLHVAAVSNGTLLQLFIGTQLAGSYLLPTENLILLNTGPFYVGGSPWHPPPLGYLADMRFYGTPLSADDLALSVLMVPAGFPPREPRNTCPDLPRQ